MSELIDVATAWARVAAAITPLPAERVPLGAAAGRIVAEPVASAVDLPPFDRSAMDGYAVRAADTDPARPLELVGEVAAGAVLGTTLGPGAAVGITTGAALPDGADAILRVEDAARDDGTVTPTAGALRVGQHVRYRGEDVHAGDVLMTPGARLSLQLVSSVASAGVGSVVVHRRARVAIAVTGDELLPLGAPPEPGRIHESNSLVLRLLAEGAGGVATVLPPVPDDFDATRRAIEAGLDAADVLLISGGVSVGPYDHVKPALEAAGVEEVFWRVRLRPGKPLWFGRRGTTLVFGLPGNPLSAVACFLLFVDPALRRLQGEADAAVRYVRARLTVPARAVDGRTTLLTARITRAEDGSLLATPTTRQGSHMTGALGESQGFVVAPFEAAEMPAGSAVDVLLLP
jgi:molybdopterin molybdotransferase